MLGKRIVVSSVVALAFGASVQAAPASVDVCHETAAGTLLTLSVGTSASAAHLAHGDALPATFWADADGDGAGDAAAATTACEAPVGYTDNAEDCDDGDAGVLPGAEDACGDGVDQDCSGDDALCATESDGWTVSSGRVELSADGWSVRGTTTFERVDPASVATRGGGGCVLADLNGGVACTKDADCDAAGLYKPAGGYHYCAAPDGSGEAKRCWTRPGTQSAFCRPNRANLPGTSTTPWGSLAAVPEDELEVLLLSCMADADVPAGCGTTDPNNYVRSLGPIRRWVRPD